MMMQDFQLGRIEALVNLFGSEINHESKTNRTIAKGPKIYNQIIRIQKESFKEGTKMVERAAKLVVPTKMLNQNEFG